MVKAGMIIGERYEILEKIGTGGMSDVYKAKCHKLNRNVAIKTLKQEFSENQNFVSKFGVEAQAAAGLSHPNIVNVYDVGEEGGIYYIVMELVEGITLKKYIEKKARLSVKEAISITIQICMGIEAAHNNNIIHRDIKPQNIIISKDGKVKVTDFGIAKAATSNTITSNVMGSVHYTSPEQARGGFSDAKSDVYSLGITMFEMLTGRVAFNGETTVAIAIKHIQEEMPTPRDYVAEIPISVEQIIFKCCQKSPDRRYQSMAELMVDLKKSLMYPDEDFVKLINPDEEGGTRNISDEDLSSIKRRRQMELQTDMAHFAEQVIPEVGDEYGDEEYYHYEDEQGDYEYHDEYADDEADYDYDPKMEKVTTVLAIIAAILIGLVVIFVAGQALGLFSFNWFGTHTTPDDEEEEEAEYVEMVEVVGMSEDAAKRALIALGLVPEIETEESSQYESGIVMRSSIQEGVLVAVGTNVVLSVSVGSVGVDVPNVVGQTAEEAIAELTREGFTFSRTDEHDDFIAVGHVFKQSPEGNTKAASGAMINLWVSRGAEERRIAIPNLIGETEADAIIILREAGLVPGNISMVTHEDLTLTGRVCFQSYAPSVFVEAGAVVDFSVSTGVPDALYSLIGDIYAPTHDEDPDFKPGTSVTVVVTCDDGRQLLNTETTSFPIQVNFTNIESSGGSIILRYVNVTDDYVIHHEDGTTETVEGGRESKEIARYVYFTRQ